MFQFYKSHLYFLDIGQGLIQIWFANITSLWMTFSYCITNPNKDKILQSLLIHLCNTYFLNIYCKLRHYSQLETLTWTRQARSLPAWGSHSWWRWCRRGNSRLWGCNPASAGEFRSRASEKGPEAETPMPRSHAKVWGRCWGRGRAKAKVPVVEHKLGCGTTQPRGEWGHDDMSEGKQGKLRLNDKGNLS